MIPIHIFPMEVMSLEMCLVQSQDLTIRNMPYNSCYAQINCKNTDVNSKVY